MADMYGYKWTSQHGVDVDKNDVWKKGLTGVSPREFADGLNIVVTEGEEWPPATPVFRKLCLHGLNTPAQKAFEKQEAAQVPVGRWITDDNKKARNQEAIDKAVARSKAPINKLTKEEHDAMLKSLDR